MRFTELKGFMGTVQVSKFAKGSEMTNGVCESRKLASAVWSDRPRALAAVRQGPIANGSAIHRRGIGGSALRDPFWLLARFP